MKKYNVLNKTLDIFEAQNLKYEEAKEIYIKLEIQELLKTKEERYEYQITER